MSLAHGEVILYSYRRRSRPGMCTHAEATQSVKVPLTLAFKRVLGVQHGVCGKALTCRDSSL
jgi:hypothetical protein